MSDKLREETERLLGLEIEPHVRLIYGDHEAHIRALQARVDELEAARQWKPIDTAPRNGSWFIGAWLDQDGHRDSEIHKARWADEYTLAEERGGNPDDWLRGSWDDGEDEIVLTHWMPLPPPHENPE